MLIKRPTRTTIWKVERRERLMLLLYTSAPIAISRLRVLINPNCGGWGAKTEDNEDGDDRGPPTISLGHELFSSIFAIREWDTIATYRSRSCTAAHVRVTHAWTLSTPKVPCFVCSCKPLLRVPPYGVMSNSPSTMVNSVSRVLRLQIANRSDERLRRASVHVGPIRLG